jgi:hypothetical protein
MSAMFFCNIKSYASMSGSGGVRCHIGQMGNISGNDRKYMIFSDISVKLILCALF